MELALVRSSSNIPICSRNSPLRSSKNFTNSNIDWEPAQEGAYRNNWYDSPHPDIAQIESPQIYRILLFFSRGSHYEQYEKQMRYFARLRRICSGRARLPLQEMIRFMDTHRSLYGVELIYKCLAIAPSTSYANLVAGRDSDKLSPKAKRGRMLKPEIHRVFTENREPVRKVWQHMQREGYTAWLALYGRLPDAWHRS